LRPGLQTGTFVVCDRVVDLQRRPDGDQPPVLPVCAPEEAAAAAAAIAGAPARTGAYVSVLGPQFETPAEARWLSAWGDVVGMSAAPEVAAAAASGVELCLVAAVVNRAAQVDSHEHVLRAGAGLARALMATLPALVVARWPAAPQPRVVQRGGSRGLQP
jgi:purine nucleoside phosphorylase